MMTAERKNQRRRGGAMLELALLGPGIMMLFIGALDWGFYAYGLISLQAATNSAVRFTRTGTALANNATNVARACDIVLKEMKSLPNVKDLTGCAALPLTVSATQVAGPDSAPAARVDVTYRTISLIPLPGMLAKQFTVTRSVTMRIE